MPRNSVKVGIPTFIMMLTSTSSAKTERSSSQLSSLIPTTLRQSLDVTPEEETLQPSGDQRVLAEIIEIQLRENQGEQDNGADLAPDLHLYLGSQEEEATDPTLEPPQDPLDHPGPAGPHLPHPPGPPPLADQADLPQDSLDPALEVIDQGDPTPPLEAHLLEETEEETIDGVTLGHEADHLTTPMAVTGLPTI
ncbi:hypothetical protein LOD99_14476 [Oopsacas minuta]|uniref:Uncharacterized protein n=1 Tax=Oopsacas minuta TaxID=111878 RepID=A0AAV7KEF8_9METZ|nr:hypothetical protein LOD99_14476 [Oopsacas minuta]